MKVKVILLILSCLIMTGCTEKNNKSNEINLKDAKIKEIQNLKESNLEIPRFTIVVKGEVEGTITHLLINDLQMYEFTVDVPTYDLDENSRVYRDTFVGVKLKDVLEKKGITEFSSIDFKGTGKITVRYLENEINDTMYIVFYRNGLLLSESEESPAMLISPTLRTRYWVPSLVRMDIN